MNFITYIADMICERNALMENTYPKLKDFCRKHGLEFQVGLNTSIVILNVTYDYIFDDRPSDMRTTIYLW